jgi:hypothetical protein
VCPERGPVSPRFLDGTFDGTAEAVSRMGPFLAPVTKRMGKRELRRGWAASALCRLARATKAAGRGRPATLVWPRLELPAGMPAFHPARGCLRSRYPTSISADSSAAWVARTPNALEARVRVDLAIVRSLVFEAGPARAVAGGKLR